MAEHKVEGQGRSGGEEERAGLQVAGLEQAQAAPKKFRPPVDQPHAAGDENVSAVKTIGEASRHRILRVMAMITA